MTTLQSDLNILQTRSGEVLLTFILPEWVLKFQCTDYVKRII